jgi:phytoene dehydrogenase-like protein
MSRRRSSKFDKSWVAHMHSMLESPAWRALSRGAHQFITRLEVEHCRHGGTANGKLIVTYADCMTWGMHPKAIAPAQREAVALGFAELTKRGRGGTAEFRRAHQWGLTYIRPNSDREPPATDDWKRIKTIEDAKRIAKEARESKIVLRTTQKKQKPRSETDPTLGPETDRTSRRAGNRPYSAQGRKPTVLSTSALYPRRTSNGA